jgi:hypothetical protein
MMLGGGGGELRGIGPGEEVSYTMRFCASIDNGDHHCCTTAMGPHSQLLSIQQSANILCNRLILIKLEKTIIINDY